MSTIADAQRADLFSETSSVEFRAGDRVGNVQRHMTERDHLDGASIQSMKLWGGLMIRAISSAAVLAAFAAITGCATIVHSGPRAIPVASTPAGAKVSIYDRDNKLVMTNTTPFVATLNTKYGYFKSQSYRLVFQMAGHPDTEVQLNSTLSGWYWGNLVFGGLVGMLVVDPLTGAMYNLTPEKIEQPLNPSQTQLLRDGKGVLVVLASQVTDSERAAMVPIN